MYKIVQRKERTIEDTAKTDGVCITTASPAAKTVAAPIRIARAPHRTTPAGTISNVPRVVSTAATCVESLSSVGINTLRTEIAKSGGSPFTAVKQSAKDVTSWPMGKPIMDASIRMIDDELELIDALKDFIIESNTKYSVVGALGAQGTGKSTILSMLAGNNPADMYRQYIFRPAAREAVEACRYQSTKISVYVVPKLRTFFLDCQPFNCAPLLEDFCRARRVKGAEALDAIELENLQLLLLLSSVCHTIILCIDWFIDLGVVRRLMRTELFLPLLFPNSTERRVNLIVLHQRAKPTDLEPLLVCQRMHMLNAIFGSSTFNINGGLTMAKMGFAIYESVCADLGVNYILLGELKPRTRIDEFEQHMRHQDDYGAVITKLRNKIYQLPNSRSTFSDRTEAQWFLELTETWKRIREEIPILTEDGCTLKRHRGSGGQLHLVATLKSPAHSAATATSSLSRCASASGFMSTQRPPQKTSEFTRARPRGKGRKGVDWGGSAGNTRQDEETEALETAEGDEAEPKKDDLRKSTGETEGQPQQKRIWRTRNRTALGFKGLSVKATKQRNIEPKMNCDELLAKRGLTKERKYREQQPMN